MMISVSAPQYSSDAFLLTGEQTPSGVIARGYDDDGLLVQAGDLSMIRDPVSGFLTGTTLGNVTDQRTYNGFGEVSQYTAQYSGADIYSVAYGYDALGRITNQAETISSETTVKAYIYDNRGRLTQVTTNGSPSESYTYDANGNRLSGQVGAELRAAAYDLQDRLLTYGDLTCQYDPNGNQTNRTVNGQTTSLSYDLFGQLSGVMLSDGRTISYDSDALGRITAKRVNGAIVKGLGDGVKPNFNT